MELVCAVIDTNIVISALLTPQGSPGKIYQAIRSGSCVMVLTEALRRELKTVLEEPTLNFPKDLIQECLQIIDQGAKFVQPMIPVSICRDPEDNKVLEAALAAFPDVVVVTGDQDLLTLKNFHDIPILSPREFIAAFHL